MSAPSVQPGVNSAAAMRATRVLEWVRCGADSGIDLLMHAQPVRSAGAQFVRVQDALALAEHVAPIAREKTEGLPTQGVSSARLSELFTRLRGARTRADASVSLEQFVTISHGPSWAGTGGVGAPAQGAVGPVSVHTLVGAARGVAPRAEGASGRSGSAR